MTWQEKCDKDLERFGVQSIVYLGLFNLQGVDRLSGKPWIVYLAPDGRLVAIECKITQKYILKPVGD